MNHSSRRIQFVSLGLLALLATILVGIAFAGGSTVRSSDEVAFVDLAGNLATYGCFAHGYDIHAPQPARSSEDLVVTAYRSPGLPLALAPVAWLGGGLMAMRMVNSLFFVAAAALVYALGVRLGGQTSGLLALLVAIANPTAIYAATTLYPQTLATLLFLAALLAVCVPGGAVGFGRVAAFGCAWGLLCMVVPTFLLIYPMGVLALKFVGRASWRDLLLASVLAALPCLAWGGRNLVVMGEFVPTATSGGYNLACGNCPDARWNTSTNVVFPSDLLEALTGKGEVERDREFRRAVSRWMTEDPARLAGLYVGKFLHWFSPVNDLRSDEVLPEGASSVGKQVRTVALYLYGVPLLCLFVIRFVFRRRCPVSRCEVVMVVAYFGAALVYAMFFTRARFRLPMDVMAAVPVGVWLAQTIVEPMLAKRGLISRAR